MLGFGFLATKKLVERKCLLISGFRECVDLFVDVGDMIAADLTNALLNIDDRSKNALGGKLFASNPSQFCSLLLDESNSFWAVIYTTNLHPEKPNI